MLDIPVGKALVAEYSDIHCNFECIHIDDYKCQLDCCAGCDMDTDDLELYTDGDACGCLCCIPYNRKDGRKVVYKVVDYPVKMSV